MSEESKLGVKRNYMDSNKILFSIFWEVMSSRNVRQTIFQKLHKLEPN